MSEKILLVEGFADQAFFKKLLEGDDNLIIHNISVEQQGGRQGLFSDKKLAEHVKKIRGTKISAIAMIVDADSGDNNMAGFQHTKNILSEKLQEHDYISEPELVPNSSGLIYKHKEEGIIPFGLYIMPNNQDNGEMEDWLAKCLTPDIQPMLKCAEKIVQKVAKKFSSPSFKPNKINKAKIYTMLAWLRDPGVESHKLLKDNKINHQSRLFSLSLRERDLSVSKVRGRNGHIGCCCNCRRERLEINAKNMQQIKMI
ncbi:MAG: DUF3226 domain-containing protein [Alphaproteobacteria bacterium]